MTPFGKETDYTFLNLFDFDNQDNQIFIKPTSPNKLNSQTKDFFQIKPT
jgi:hypothetical protein